MMVHLIFASDPDRMPTNKVSIFGEPRCSADKMRAYAARRNPQAPEVAEMYLEKAEPYGIRGDVAFCQAMLDTQVWTAEPQGPPWKPFAYGIWGGLAYTDRSKEELACRIDRHLLRLSKIVDSHKTNEPCWEDLGGAWAVSDTRYGRDVVAIWRNMMAWRGDEALNKAGKHASSGFEMAEAALAAGDGLAGGLGEEKRQESAGTVIPSTTRNRTSQALPAGRTAEDHIAWLSTHAWVPTPQPHPGRKVSWGELARVLGSLENQRK